MTHRAAASMTSRLSGFAVIVAGICGAPEVVASPLPWSTTQAPAPGPQWNTVTATEAAARGISWQTTSPGDQPISPARVDSDQEAPQAAPPTRPAPANPWIVGIGGGARIGAGEPTYPMIYGRVGRAINDKASISLRPRYIFGNSDQQGRSNNEGAFQMPLTLDLKLTTWLNPYVGGGIATNTDSTGKTQGMLSFGTDIFITNNLAIDLGMNYILQTADSDNRDIEFTSVLYLRF